MFRSLSRIFQNRKKSSDTTLKRPFGKESNVLLNGTAQTSPPLTKCLKMLTTPQILRVATLKCLRGPKYYVHLRKPASSGQCHPVRWQTLALPRIDPQNSRQPPRLRSSQNEKHQGWRSEGISVFLHRNTRKSLASRTADAVSLRGRRFLQFHGH